MKARAGTTCEVTKGQLSAYFRRVAGKQHSTVHMAETHIGAGEPTSSLLPPNLTPPTLPTFKTGRNVWGVKENQWSSGRKAKRRKPEKSKSETS